jgi:1A family penicillin-binding protein
MKIRKLFKILVFLLIISLTGLILYLKLSPKIIINSANNITLYDKDEKVFFKGSESKEWINYDDISSNLIDATIYTEDKNFYKHFGFDFLRIGKALITNLKNKSMDQGASTITQQYAKNLFLDFDKTWKRKIQEAWYTLKIEANYSKKEILEGYLNTINYGHAKYGIENASKFYFNKSSKDLDLAEASLLAAIPKAPSMYDPINNYNDTKKRQLYILNNLVKNNIITKEEKDIAYNEELNIIGYNEKDDLSSINYFQDAVMKELKSISSIPNNYSDVNGLKIYTTLDYNSQSILEKNIKEVFGNNEELETSSVVMDPNDGSVLALVGGRDYNKSSYNRVISSKRQVGSTMKPFLYYKALENGMTITSTFRSEKTNFVFSNNDIYTPQNFADRYPNKDITMIEALAYSDNIYAVKTHLFLGEKKLVSIANRLGINGELEAVPSLALGTEEISLFDMVTSYAAFANMGNKVNGHFIKKIEDSSGKVLYEYKDEKVNILNESLVYILNEMLTYTHDTDFIDYNYPTLISLLPKMTNKYAVKSGTTNTDMWIIGYNKNAVLGVWTGYDDNHKFSSDQTTIHKDIWIDNMEKYCGDKDNTWYAAPNNVVGVFVNPITGELAKNEDKKKKLFYFVKGTEPFSDYVYDLDAIFKEEKENSN